jgi:rod shape-determining protein MreC
MRNLRLFIVKNYFFILFLLLQVVALTLLSSSSNYHKQTIFNSSNNVVGFFLEKKHDVQMFFSLRSANEQLLKENAFLRAKLKSSHYKNQNNSVEFGDSLYKKQFDFLPAQVISGTVNKRNNYFTLNRGSLNGVEKGDGVVANGCMIGFIGDVSDNYANVITILNEKFMQSVRLTTNNEHGLVVWDGRNPSIVELRGIPLDATVHGGDSLLTQGTSGRFPSDIFVGTVYSVGAKQGSPHHYIRVKLGIDLNAVYNVMIVKNRFKKEVLKIEEAQN